MPPEPQRVRESLAALGALVLGPTARRTEWGSEFMPDLRPPRPGSQSRDACERERDARARPPPRSAN